MGERRGGKGKGRMGEEEGGRERMEGFTAVAAEPGCQGAHFSKVSILAPSFLPVKSVCTVYTASGHVVEIVAILRPRKHAYG